MNSFPSELSKSVHAEITEYCISGDALAEQECYEEAVFQYNKAWEMIPEPKNEWEASTWVLAAIADACFFMGKRKSARQALEYAMYCPGGLGNPFLHLRLGQVLFDAGELDKAADELMRAYLGGGGEIFAQEDQRYFDFLVKKAKI
ncbi:tetratricopeptide repeat protein [Chitinimonas lacunae]|uniref:Tetratricopeptide repeat protein n=1 Tax=Chitinimonas lacunae TaxID=1963018 RepID=A0ABV8MMQ6_9NEIS